MRKYEETNAIFVDEFIAEVPPRRGIWQNNYYRGHADGSWEITPGLFRADLADSDFSTWLELANSRNLRFKQLAPSEIRGQMATELEWTATACHHGVPTSFSAWSESALVGLFFATEPTPDKADGAVWRLMPGHDEMTILQDYEMVPDAPRIYLPQFQNRRDDRSASMFFDSSFSR